MKEETRVIVKRREANGITMLEMFSDDGRKKPLILVYHGYQNSKESMLPHAYRLAREGFFTVLPDVYMHGERNPEGKKPDIFEAVLKSSAEADIILSLYKDVNDADIANAGITGYSMGGFIVHDRLASGRRRFDAAVAVISSPDWASLMDTEWGREYFSERGIAPGSEKMKELRAYTNEIQPLGRYGKMQPTPLLMINGGRDLTVPPGGSVKLFEMLYGLYDNKDDISLSIHHDTGHDRTYEMDTQMTAWFVRHLGKGRHR